MLSDPPNSGTSSPADSNLKKGAGACPQVQAFHPFKAKSSRLVDVVCVCVCECVRACVYGNAGMATSVASALLLVANRE
eukprot:1146609-Pelagomonas_calceolata.AAC.1